MSARNRRLPRHRAWPLTTSDINECLSPYMTRDETWQLTPHQRYAVSDGHLTHRDEA
ncbi:hypothetical protein [Streptomyces sp. NPDC058424]|uniref:hypothetical protein n=1 Tax=Streptomyces sp. NPDC058424 TaxID=3346491 RepID=UPI0036586556